MNTLSAKNRSAYWDNIKGILIFLVVFAHILSQLQDRFETINATVDYIYMFHMPAFIFISGFFGKSERSHSFESIIKLIFLYFIFNSIMGFIYGFTSLLQPMYSCWYLVALIVWRITTHHIAKFKKINLILFVTALFIGFYPDIDNTFAAARIIGFYPYYMIGYQLSEEKSVALINKKYIRRAADGILFLMGAGGIAFTAYQYFRYTDDALLMIGYQQPIEVFGRIVLYLTAFLTIYALRCLSPDRKIPLVTMFGRNSLWIFILHRPFTLMLSDYICDLSLPIIFLLSVPSSLGLCILLGNDVIAKYMNLFLQAGTDIFLSDKKKVNYPSSKVNGPSLLYCYYNKKATLLSTLTHRLKSLGLRLTLFQFC